MTFQEKLRMLRQNKKLSQSNLAEILETTQQHYCAYELGKHEPPLRHIVTLCRYYNISADWLLGLKEE